MYTNQIKRFIKGLKSKVIEKVGKENISYEMGPNGETCLELWAMMFPEEDYSYKLKPIQLTQYKKYLLLRYKPAVDIIKSGFKLSESDFWNMYDGLYRECRSCVIDLESETLEFISLPFDKFFNIGQIEETSLENIKERINNAKCVEFSDKLDGSMVCASWYKNDVVLSTANALDPENSWRLKAAINMFNSDPHYRWMAEYGNSFTFIFEMISQADAHVVVYPKEMEGLYLIGIRNKRSGALAPYSKVIEFAKEWSIPSTEIFSTNIDEVMNNLDKKKGYEKEGFVIYIDEFMVKVKYDDYSKLHGIIGSISSVNAVISSIVGNTYDDLVAKVPSMYRKKVEKVGTYVLNWVAKQSNFVESECKRINEMFSEDKEKFIYVNEKGRYNSLDKSWIMQKLKGEKVNYLVLRNGHQLKLKEMGIPESEYKSFVEEVETDE